MVEQYDWLVGQQATYAPVPREGGTRTGESGPGRIVEIRDDSPTPDEEHLRVVIEFDERVVDVAKERVTLV